MPGGRTLRLSCCSSPLLSVVFGLDNLPPGQVRRRRRILVIPNSRPPSPDCCDAPDGSSGAAPHRLLAYGLVVCRSVACGTRSGFSELDRGLLVAVEVCRPCAASAASARGAPERERADREPHRLSGRGQFVRFARLHADDRDLFGVWRAHPRLNATRRDGGRAPRLSEPLLLRAG